MKYCLYKKWKSFYLILLTLLISLVFIGCKNEKIELIGESQVKILESVLLEHNYDGEDEIKWISSDNSIATVENGIVTGKEIGNVIITLIIGEETFEHQIEVIANVFEIKIKGVNNINVGDTVQFTYECEKEFSEKEVWESSNTDVAFCDENGLVTGKNAGQAEIKVSLLGNVSVFKVEVVNIKPQTISITGVNKLEINKETKLNVTITPENADASCEYFSSDEAVATVSSDGIVRGISLGNVTITVMSLSFPSVFSVINIEIIEVSKEIIIQGKTLLEQGELNFLSCTLSGEEITDLNWETSNNKVAIIKDGIMLGVNKGEVTIQATLKNDPSFKGKIIVSITKYTAEEESEEDLENVAQILSKMTIEQKVGQMFVVGFNGTEMSGELASSISEYHFGNVIYMGANVSVPGTIAQMSNDIQNQMVESNGVGAFIATDQEGGRVTRLTNGATHFISNMALGATNDYNNSYLVGKAMGLELANYGINVDFAPVMDVNNNPDNPVIGVRSYSDNPIDVSLFSTSMIKGLKESNILGCAKHFPGHGNTSVDSHYGLPKIDTDLENLYQTELAPFISAVQNGIDAIMTTHIIFSVIDEDYPATLSKKVLNDLLRSEIGYDGLIITDGMEMDAISRYFGTYDKTAVLAINAGVDILTYTSLYNPITAYNGVLKAIKDQTISESRIDESVTRILLKKLKMGIISGKEVESKNISDMLLQNEALNNTLSEKSLTKVLGSFNGLDIDKKTLIISPTSNYSLSDSLESNSLGCLASKYLKEKGYDVDYIDVRNNVSSSQATNIQKEISKYDKIVLAFSNVKTTNLTSTKNLVNQIIESGKEVIIIALDSPYDLLSYNTNGYENVSYICVYGYQKAAAIAITRYLNGEFTATGKLPING